jgi:DNA-binding NtrC family response regulator
MVQEAAEDIIPAEVPADIPRGTESILLVEDEEGVRELTQRILKEQGYKVTCAKSGDQAFSLCGQMEKAADMVVTDVVMPNMSGPELVEKVRARWPNVKVIYMSGYTPNAIVHNGVLDPEIPYLQKPFQAAQLARKVREVLDR